MAVSSRLPGEISCCPNGNGRTKLAPPIRDLAPGLGHLGREALPGREELLSKFIVQFADLLRLSDKVRIGQRCELGLNFNGLVERPHAHQLLDKGSALLE